MDQKQISEVIELHSKAYRLLLWLDRQAIHDPEVLSQEREQIFSDGISTAQWFEREKFYFPAELIPSDDRIERFAFLFSSFFYTSFHIRRMWYQEQCIEARLLRHSAFISRSRAGKKDIYTNALKKLAKEIGFVLDYEHLKALRKSPYIRPDLILWTYVWELDRRSRKQSKGEILRYLWRQLDITVRKDLTMEKVWQAKTRIIEAIREIADPQRN